jgi:hypothetical protein
MEWEIYRLERLDTGPGYWFYSEGPRGRIRKVVEFQWMRWIGTSTFNLAFGDSEEGSAYLNDRSVSNNQDRLKVLHTVATAVIDFLKDHARSIVLIKANSIARARLYQMMIASIWKEIEEDYEVQGKHGRYWMPFVKGLNYSEFIVYKKIV